MIRFRLGQSWKHERGSSPVDAFGLELDGVNVLAQASEEALDQVVSELAEALHALCAKGERIAQLSLPEAHLELSLLREGTSAELCVAALSRPARLMRRFSLDLSELREAAARCIRGFLVDVAERSPERGRRLRRLLDRKLSAIEHRPLSPSEAAADPGFSYRATPAGGCAFGFWLRDPQDRIRAYRARTTSALASLLCDGETWLQVGGQTLWRASGPPVLVALELSRQAAELAHALDTQEPALSLQIGGSGAPLQLRQSSDQLTAVDHPELDARSLASAMCELGLALAFAVASRHRPQVRNPHIVDLSERCRVALAALRVAPEPEPGGVARAGRAGSKGKPLSRLGRLRRLRFEALWHKRNLGGENPGRLLLGPRGPVFVSAELACGFSRHGHLLFRRVATHGVAADGFGRVLTASANQVAGFWGSDASARWFRDHDGIPLGPDLWVRDRLWVTLSTGRAVLAFDAVTGRELWRLAPPRTQHCFVSVQAHRALVATDSGYLYGLDLHDGQVRYRMRTSLPFTGPLVAWERRAVGALGRGDSGALFVSDAHRGSVLWAHEVASPLGSAPIASRARVFFTTLQGEEGTLICMTSKGERAWERPLQLGPGPFALAPVDRSTLVCSRSGAAVLIDSGGVVVWRLGSAGERLSTTVQPRTSAGLLLIPGATVRAVEPRTGEVVGEVAAGAGLCGLAADTKLNLYLLGDEGTLQAHRVGTHLSVLGER